MNTQSKIAKYQRLYKQISKYVGTTKDTWARLATIEAVLHNKIKYYSWTGVYILSDGELIVRSYQGSVACQVLEKDKGVCWEAINKNEPIIVYDVNDFVGHIPCDSRTKSEVVIPLKDKNGEIIGCFDVDSTEIGSFDYNDAEGLEKILTLLSF